MNYDILLNGIEKEKNMDNNSAKIKFISGQYAGSEIEVAPFATITFGRNPQVANFVFYNEGISRKHCSIQYDPNERRFMVTDYSSSGTYINNVKKMQPGVVEYLDGGDTIRLGKSDDVVQFIAPQRFDSMHGINNHGEAHAGGDIDDKKTMKMPAGQPVMQQPVMNNNIMQQPIRENKAMNNSGSLQPNNVPHNNQVNVNNVTPKMSPVLGIVGTVIGGLALVFGLYSIIYILAEDSDHFAPMSVVYISGMNGEFEIIAAIAFIGLILGVVQLAKNNHKDSKVQKIGTAAVVVSVVALILLGFIYLAAASCPRSELVEYGIEQAGDTLDDMLNDMFR